MELLIEHLGKGLGNILLLSMPIVLTAAGVGLVVGIVQAITQVQEQTIAAAPKILAVFLVIILGGGFMMQVLSDYLRESFKLSLEILPKEGIFSAEPNGEMTHTEIFFKEDKLDQRYYDGIFKNGELRDEMEKVVEPPFEKSVEKKVINTDLPMASPDVSIAEEKALRQNRKIENAKPIVPAENVIETPVGTAVKIPQQQNAPQDQIIIQSGANEVYLPAPIKKERVNNPLTDITIDLPPDLDENNKTVLVLKESERSLTDQGKSSNVESNSINIKGRSTRIIESAGAKVFKSTSHKRIIETMQ